LYYKISLNVTLQQEIDKTFSKNIDNVRNHSSTIGITEDQ